MLSQFTALSTYLIQEQSEATPGLFNNPLSVLSQNLDQLNTGNWSTSSLIVQSYDSGGQVYNVKAFGVTGDGVTNDTSNISRAQLAASQVSAILFYPPGTYLVTPNTIGMINGRRNVWRGSGRENTIIKASTAGGPVVSWVGGSTHPVTEEGCELADLAIEGNGASGSTMTTVFLKDLTFFHAQRLTINNGANRSPADSYTSAPSMGVVSLFDSTMYDIYVAGGGNSANTVVVMDSSTAGGSNGDSINNCQFYDLHIETGSDALCYLELKSNSTNPMTECSFYGLKVHGPIASGLPNGPLLSLNSWVQGVRFLGGTFASGKSIAQIVTDGQRNTWVAIDIALSSVATPSYAIQMTGNSNTEHFIRPNFKNSSAYSAMFRAESGALHNGMFFPTLSSGTPYSDAGRAVVFYDDINKNTGYTLYAADGFRIASVPLYAWAGTVGEPSYAFDAENLLGLYRSAASAIALSYGQLQMPSGTALQPPVAMTSEASLGLYRSGASTIAQSYGTFLGPAIWATSGLSVGNSTAGGSLIPAISSLSSLIAAFVVQPSASSFTLVAWPAVQPGDQILVTVQPSGAVSSLSSGLVMHSHCTKAGQIEFRLSNVSTLSQNQSSRTYYFTRITPF